MSIHRAQPGDTDDGVLIAAALHEGKPSHDEDIAAKMVGTRISLPLQRAARVTGSSFRGNPAP
jgi:hypothetical protein